jgi:hypothetical protein
VHARNALVSSPLAGDRRRRGPISWRDSGLLPVVLCCTALHSSALPSAGADWHWSATPIDAAGLAGLPPRFQLSGSGSLHPLKHRHCTPAAARAPRCSKEPVPRRPSVDPPGLLRISGPHSRTFRASRHHDFGQYRFQHLQRNGTFFFSRAGLTGLYCPPFCPYVYSSPLFRHPGGANSQISKSKLERFCTPLRTAQWFQRLARPCPASAMSSEKRGIADF